MGSTYDLARFGAERPSFFATTGGYVARNGDHSQENGSSLAPGLYTDG
jgi:hypothetical protein